MSTTRHLDLGCGERPRNPYGCNEVHAVDISDAAAQAAGVAADRFRRANLSVEPIPHIDSSFDSVSAFDFLEHVPRVLNTADGRGTRLPFIELMSEIHRVLKPGGKFYAMTPAYPRDAAFLDPTHVNVIASGTWRYFCTDPRDNALPMARIYGFGGNFRMLRNEWALLPEAFSANAALPWPRRLKRWQRERLGRLTHLVWEFECVKTLA